ncbi:MAG: ATP synthase F1 subunit delta [Candidatus Onthovivens sp.]
MNKDALLIKITEGFFKNAEQNKLEVVYGENLKFIAWSISKNDNLKNFLDNPFISLSEKNEALDNIFSDVINSDVLRFAKILLEQNLLNSIWQVRQIYHDLLNDSKDILEGKIYTPFELSEDQISKLEDIFSQKTRKTSIFHQIIDKDLIAGIKVVINGYQYEYTIKDELTKRKNKIIQAIKEEENYGK